MRSQARDGPLVVGAVVRRPHGHRGAGCAVAHAVEGRAGAAVDDLVAAVARAVEAPLLVVAAAPRRLPGVGSVGGVAPAVGDHAVGTVDDAVPPTAQVHELPLQVGAAVPVPLLEVRPRGDIPAAVQRQAGGRVRDPHVGRRRGAAGPGHAGSTTRTTGQSDDVVLGFGDADGVAGGGVDHLVGPGEDPAAHVDRPVTVEPDEDLGGPAGAPRPVHGAAAAPPTTLGP